MAVTEGELHSQSPRAAGEVGGGRWEVGGGAISSTTMRFVHYLGPLELLSQVRVPLATSSHPPGEPSVTGVIYHMREILAFKLFFSTVKSNTGTHTHE